MYMPTLLSLLSDDHSWLSQWSRLVISSESLYNLHTCPIFSMIECMSLFLVSSEYTAVYNTGHRLPYSLVFNTDLLNSFETIYLLLTWLQHRNTNSTLAQNPLYWLRRYWCSSQKAPFVIIPWKLFFPLWTFLFNPQTRANVNSTLVAKLTNGIQQMISIIAYHKDTNRFYISTMLKTTEDQFNSNSHNRGSKTILNFSIGSANFVEVSIGKKLEHNVLQQHLTRVKTENIFC